MTEQEFVEKYPNETDFMTTPSLVDYHAEALAVKEAIMDKYAEMGKPYAALIAEEDAKFRAATEEARNRLAEIQEQAREATEDITRIITDNEALLLERMRIYKEGGGPSTFERAGLVLKYTSGYTRKNWDGAVLERLLPKYPFLVAAQKPDTEVAPRLVISKE